MPEIVAKQRDAGIDVVSDGEMSKPGFSNYINDRFTGFEGRAEFQADDVADFPNLAMRLFNTPAMAHLVFSNCVDEVEVKDPDAVRRDVERLKSALGDTPPDQAFMGAISPGQIAFNFPDHHYGSHEKYLAALGEALRHEYKAITDAGFNLQIDSPDLAMAGALPLGRRRASRAGTRTCRWRSRRSTRRSTASRAEQVRLHVCWGNYARPAPQGRAAARHHRAGASRRTPGRSTSRAPTRATSTSGRSSRRSTCPTART